MRRSSSESSWLTRKVAALALKAISAVMRLTASSGRLIFSPIFGVVALAMLLEAWFALCVA